MDFRKTYSGPSRFESRLGNDPFAQLSKDTRQDDRAKQDPAGSKGANRHNSQTQSSANKPADNTRAYRNSLSATARLSGHYSPLSNSTDLGPALKANAHTGSNIPRQPGAQHTPSGSQFSPAAKLQDLLSAGQQREALLEEQKRQLETDLHTATIRCSDLALALQQSNTALEAERAEAARLRHERDTAAAELDRARSQAAELQVSGRIALTTSEVCRAALSTAFKGTVTAIGSAHEELESVLEAQRQQEGELALCRMRVLELELAAQEREAHLEHERCTKGRLAAEMEELATQLLVRQEQLESLVKLLVPAGTTTPRAAYEAAAIRARELPNRVVQLEGQCADLVCLRDRLAEYQAQMARLEGRLRGGAGPGGGAGMSDGGATSPERRANLEARVTGMAEEREQLEGDNLQLAAENEHLRREAAGLREQLTETVQTAAVVKAAAESSSAALRLSQEQEARQQQQQLDELAAQLDEWRRQAATAAGQAEEARRELGAVRTALEAALKQAEGARAEAEDAMAAQAEKFQQLSVELVQLRARAAELQDTLAGNAREVRAARDQLAAMHDNEGALLQRIMASEAERQQLLKQLDAANSTAADLNRRLEVAVQQAADAGELRGRVAELGAAAAAGARLAPLEAELQDLRAAMRESKDRASHESRLQERREQQLAVLRQQLQEAQEQQLAADKEIGLLRAQVAVNDSLRGRIEDLQARLSQATLPKPTADAAAQVSTGSTIPGNPSDDADTAAPAPGPAVFHGSGLFRLTSPDSHPPNHSALLAAQAAAVRHPLAAGWLGTATATAATAAAPGGPQALFPPNRVVVGDSLLEPYNTIPEEELEDVYGRRPSSSLRPGPLRLLVGMVVKGTLVAGGMALGLALGNPAAFQALSGPGGGVVPPRGRLCEDGMMEGVGMPL